MRYYVENILNETGEAKSNSVIKLKVVALQIKVTYSQNNLENLHLENKI